MMAVYQTLEEHAPAMSPRQVILALNSQVLERTMDARVESDDLYTQLSSEAPKWRSIA